ncbi:MAG: transglycosylase SLT domain-containing protein [Sphingomonadaceae bacterium]
MTTLLLAVAPIAFAPACAQPVPAAFANQAEPSSQIGSAISQWKLLQQSDTQPFSSYAGFLLSNPGWPDESALRKSAEKTLRSTGESASLIVAFFVKYPPQTPTAQLRFADALAALGNTNEAKTAARLAWTRGALTADDEAGLLSRFPGLLSAADHDERMDQLLWQRSTLVAARQLTFVTPSKRALFEARLALLTKAPDAAARYGAVAAAAKDDASFLYDLNYWQRSTGQIFAARDTLAGPRQLSAPPIDPDKWLDMLYANAKGASNDRQYPVAFNIARQISDTYPAGTNVSERSFSERDTYTDLAWLGGQIALTKLGRPADAVALFTLYAGAAKSAQTRAKGFYWAGRAAEAAGQRERAQSYYQSAGQYFDQFHGQLALERLGQPIVPPTIRRTVEISGSQRDAFERSPIVKAARYLGQQGQWFDQSKFIRAIAAMANDDATSVLATELAAKINRPDLAVMIGRNARTSGLGDYLRTAFPQITVPSEIAGSWTMIHAIARQESQFDRQIISRAGARGLMQLLPGTARETAPRAGVSYDLASLYDPVYNIRLGSTYYGQLMDRYSGSYVLAVCAYNAGPGNVNKWLAANGDPRVPGTDVLAWIEAIPLSETRNYVQRVLENAVVYDLLNPGRANIRSATPLSSYLGKSQPG